MCPLVTLKRKTGAAHEAKRSFCLHYHVRHVGKLFIRGGKDGAGEEGRHRMVGQPLLQGGDQRRGVGRLEVKCLDGPADRLGGGL